MNNNKVNSLIRFINRLHEEHLLVRTFYHEIREKDLHQLEVTNKSVKLFDNTIKGKIIFEKPIDDKTRAGLNDIAHFLNQNFIIRLCCCLEVGLPMNTRNKDNQPIHHIDDNIDGAKELKLLRMLRNRFAHSDGNYDPKNKRHKDLQKQISEVCNLSVTEEDQDNFTLSKDKVIGRLVKACNDYITEYSRKYPETFA